MKVRFWQRCRPLVCSFTKIGPLFQAFLKDLVYVLSWQNYRTTILKKTFSIRTFPVTASVYANDFLKKLKK